MLEKAALLLLVTSCLALNDNDIILNATPNVNLTTEDLSLGSRTGRDYYPPSYSYDDDKGKFNSYNDYQPSTNYIPYKEEAPPNCPPNPLGPLLGNGVNFLLLKLGALGVLKSFLAIIFVIFLFKLPIFLAKAAIVKALVVPALIAPLMMLFSNAMGNNMMSMMMPDKKPANNNNNNNNNNNDNSEGSGRAIDDLMGSAAWQSVRFLLDSDRCAERMACQFGTMNNDTVSGAALVRMARYAEQSLPVHTKHRIRTLRKAFIEGNEGGECSSSNYACETPHLYVSQGGTNFKVL